MVCLTEHLRLAAVIRRKTTKFILSVISKESPRRGGVRPPTTNSRCCNPRARMWEMARTCGGFSHRWAPFSSARSEIFVLPISYCWNKWEFLYRHATHTQQIPNTPRDAFIPLGIFSSFMVHERITAKNIYKFGEEDSAPWKLRH